MIFDLAKNLDFYRGLGIGSRYAKAVEFLKNTDLKKIEPGKYQIDGDDVFANVVEYTTIPWEEATFEAHEEYTDIQYMITGSEIMTYAPVKQLNMTVPYDAQKDCMLFDNANPGLRMEVQADSFVIFNPWDGHKPKAADGEPAPIKKVIIKIKEK